MDEQVYNRKKTLLITGASGFIGSFLTAEGLRKGFEVWAGIRRTSSRKYLTDERIHFAELDLSDKSRMKGQLLAYKKTMGDTGWDYVVHTAGATKCLHEEDFHHTNTEGTQHLIEALQETGMVPERFVFLSSLSVFGAIREQPVRKASTEHPWIYNPILPSDTPSPNTAYGKSKLQAEIYIQQQENIPFTILRPTGVYGPREKDYFMMAKSIRQHIDFAVGYQPQEITFVYVLDIVQAVFGCMASERARNKAYFLSDGQVYNSRRFSDLLQKHLGIRRVLHLKAPLWLLKIICNISTGLSHLTGRMNALNNDKYHILSQRNWQCDISSAREDFGYSPEWPLERGVEAAVKWYMEKGWL